MAKKRFLKSVISTAEAQESAQMPWSRGARRAAFVLKRSQPPRLRKSA